MSSAALLCPNPPRRADLAWKHAEASAVRSAYFTISLARWEAPRDLSHRAGRVLSWFCALHRESEVGYIGTRAPLDAVADAVADATREPCSRSTLERGLRELQAEGYLLKSYGYGDTGRQITPDFYARDRVVVLTLTEKARAVWGPMPTPEHKASKCRSYNQGPPSGSPSEAPSFEGSSARADVEATPDRDVALEASHAVPGRSSGLRGRSAAPLEPRQSPRTLAPLAQLADGNRLEETSQAVCHRGGTVAPRRAPRPSGSGPVSRRDTVAAVLETLRAVCYGRGRLEALVIARAAFELTAGSAAAEEGSGLDWDYWLARWPQLTRAERRRFARAELVPLLVPVSSPASSSRSSSSSRTPARSSSSSSSSRRGEPSTPRRSAGDGEPSTPPRPQTIHLSGELSSPELEAPVDPKNPFAEHFKRLFPDLK